MKPWPWLGDAAATAARRQSLRRLLGPLPERGEAPQGELIGSEVRTFAHIEQWRLQLNCEEAVPALLLLPPAGALRGLVLYCHAHGNDFAVGKGELLQGRPALQSPPYGEVLPPLGFAVLAIDHWCFGERAHRSERAWVKQLLWDGCTLWGYRVHDGLMACEWLRGQARFAGLPMAALGLSMGSTMAVWLAALDSGIERCIELCCLADFDSLLACGAHDRHGEYYFVPGLRRDFSAAEIAALIAPRPHLSLLGRDDPLTPPAGAQRVDQALRAAYACLGRADAWQQAVFDCGHAETPAMRGRVLQSLEAMAPRG